MTLMRACLKKNFPGLYQIGIEKVSSLWQLREASLRKLGWVLSLASFTDTRVVL